MEHIRGQEETYINYLCLLCTSLGSIAFRLVPLPMFYTFCSTLQNELQDNLPHLELVDKRGWPMVLQYDEVSPPWVVHHLREFKIINICILFFFFKRWSYHFLLLMTSVLQFCFHRIIVDGSDNFISTSVPNDPIPLRTKMPTFGHRGSLFFLDSSF